MISKLTKIIPFIVASILGINFFITSPVLADDICSNPNVSQAVKNASGCGGGGGETLDSALSSILKAIILIMGLVAVVFIIVGGVNYITSGGDATKVKKARETILYAVIGLLICALAFAIVQFVISDILQQS